MFVTGVDVLIGLLLVVGVALGVLPELSLESSLSITEGLVITIPGKVGLTLDAESLLACIICSLLCV
jgi:hypothetical protein